MALIVAPRVSAQDPTGIRTVTEWTEQESLRLFAACDRNADDLLDLFEIRHALIDLGGTRDPAIIRRLDLDASGFLEWPEFDARFRSSIERSGEFRVQPCSLPAELRDPIAPPSDVDPTEHLLSAVDTDGNGSLSRTEFEGFLSKMNRERKIADRFPDLDLDGSGELDAREFAPILQFVPQVWQKLGGDEEARRGLPVEFRGADRNLDGVIDRGELLAGLVRIQPSLARWTDRILAAADRTRNGSLGSAELSAARGKAQAAAELR